MSMSDSDLLRQYAQHGSQEAFATLVSRYLNLVHSAARRQVPSPQQAEEVTQSVFVDLARQAHGLGMDAPLAAWLYLVTRRTAIDTVRRESRRLCREHTASEIAAMKTTSPDWLEMEPMLDEAMGDLGEADRSALLLRYFENKSLREVGRALGTSEDAAQKRVSRAVEHLRGFFSRRGIAVTAAGVVSNISANAIQTAPAALGVTISATAALSSATLRHAAIETSRALAMTTIQKTLTLATLAVAIGAGFYEARVAARRESQLLALQELANRLGSENRQLIRERDGALAKLDAAQAELEAARLRLAGGAGAGSGDLEMEAELKSVLARIGVLKHRLSDNSGLQIPEFQLLKDMDWIKAVLNHKMESDDDVRAALAELRNNAKMEFAASAQAALRGYSKSNDGQLPPDILQLAPFFPAPVDPSILQRYSMLRSGPISETEPSNFMVGENNPPIDDRYDARLRFSLNGFALDSFDKR